MYFAFVFLILVLFLTWIIWDNWDSKAPPGPIRIPFLGTLVQLALADKEGYMAMHKLSGKYGDVMSLKMGFLEVVILASYEAIKDVFNKDEVLGRHCEGMFRDRCLNRNSGILFSSGKFWLETRQFCKETLRDYGFGKRSAMEQIMHEEIGHLLKYISKESDANGGQIHFCSDYFHFAFANSLANIMTGSRHDYEDVEIQNLLKASKDYAESGVVASGIMTAYPFLRHVFPEALGRNIQEDAMARMLDYARNLFEIRKKHNHRTNPLCFTDDFLNKMEEDVAANKSKEESIFTENDFLVLFTDLLQTGSETSSNSVNFTLLHLVCNPKIQERMYQEILATCGAKRLPTIEDRASMPFTKAVVLEGIRWARTAVNGLPRKVTRSFEYRSHRIKKGTLIMMNTHSVFFDEAFWGDPFVFRPDRFLDDKNELISSKAERINIAFGAGKRVCFGEVLARDSSFLVLTALIQKFSFQVPENQEEPNVDPVVGFSTGVHPYNAVVRPRQLEVSF